ncbi:MAG TPA: DedA family protein [Rhodanobacteraceae bacterium]|jgi:membrane protein YqaA with SNARE-associated domain|nr:DedA family protein [Rhodanobacteraceae bacterium]
MKLFRPMYEKALEWAAKPRADVGLALLSFVEAFIFPIAPEIMLAPMTLARPRKWWQFASISLFFSLLGSLVGYALGHYAFEALKPALASLGWLPHLESLVHQFGADAKAHPWEAFWLLVAAGFVPIPMKVASWACGIVGVPMLPFLGGIAIGRGKRVYLVSGAIRLGGERAEKALHKHIETAGWVIVAIVVALALYFWLR